MKKLIVAAILSVTAMSAQADVITVNCAGNNGIDAFVGNVISARNNVYIGNKFGNLVFNDNAHIEEGLNNAGVPFRLFSADVNTPKGVMRGSIAIYDNGMASWSIVTNAGLLASGECR